MGRKAEKQNTSQENRSRWKKADGVTASKVVKEIHRKDRDTEEQEK